MTIYNDFVIDGKIESEIAHVQVEPDSLIFSLKLSKRKIHDGLPNSIIKIYV